MTAPLTIAVHTAPMIPFAGPPARGPGDEPMWSPMSSTLVAGEREAILVDTPVTISQVDALADWIAASGTHLTGVYITHGHADHWIGLARLQERFPDARGFATAEVVARAEFEATDPATLGYWNTIFEGQLSEQRTLPEVMDSPEFELEGLSLRAISVGQSDTEHSTVLHVPSARAVVCGDVVYNGVHLMTAETDVAGRDAWVASLEKVAALDPLTVVAGHKHVGAPDTPDTIAATQQYLRDFSRIVDTEESVEDIVAAMLALHGERDNPRVLWHGARVAVSKRG